MKSVFQPQEGPQYLKMVLDDWANASIEDWDGLEGTITMSATGLDEMPHVDRDEADVIFGDDDDDVDGQIYWELKWTPPYFPKYGI